jgi:hypothetical protein
MSDVALRVILLWRGALSSEVARTTTVEAAVAGGAGKHSTGGGGGRALGAAC